MELHGSNHNPLLTHLPPRRSKAELARALRFIPTLTGDDPAERAKSLVNLKSAFVPTRIAAEAVFGLQNILYDSLEQRDPRVEANRRRIFEIAALRGISSTRWPWFPEDAGGAIFQGLTGCGKSHAWKRLVATLPQVIDHGPMPECGWLSLKQLVYLHVELSHDGSPKGFIAAAFLALDQALGTNYTSLHVRDGISAEKQLVEFMHKLCLHRCGLLILEEAQKRKLVDSQFSGLMLDMMLRLLNFGIPVLLVGNPLGFMTIFEHAQNTRRLTTGGLHDFTPAFNSDDEQWERDLFPAIWRVSIFDEPDEYSVEDMELRHRIWKYTGGVPEHLCRLRKAVLEEASSDPNATRVTRLHIRAVLDGPAMAAVQKLIDGLVSYDYAGLASKLKDFPLEWMQSCMERFRKRAARRSKAINSADAASAANVETAPASPGKPTGQSGEAEPEPPRPAAAPDGSTKEPRADTPSGMPAHLRDLINVYRSLDSKPD